MKEFVYLAAVAAMAAVVSGDVPQTCPDDGLWFLPNPFDCTRYYRCYMGKTFEFPCLEDSVGKQLCFVEGKTYCGRWDECSCIRDRVCRTPEDNHKWPNPEDKHGYYQCQNGTVHWVPCKDNEVLDPATMTCRPESNGECPPPGSSKVVRKPHHCLCQYYYECKDGQLTSQMCPDGQLFDADMLICRRADVARCNGKPPLCPKDGTFPNENSCYEYYTCKDGVKTPQKCPAGLIFDNVKLLCVPWDRGNCSGNDFTTPKPTCEGWDKWRKPNRKDCNRYYECINGNVQNGKCLENHYFNEHTLDCDLKQNVQCNDGKNGNDSECPPIDCGTVRFPHPDCEWFYECQSGKKVPTKCPPGLAYNKERSLCDHPSNVQCKQTGCSAGKLVPHQCQCNMYYVCNNKGDKVLESCPAGKNFDEVTLNCTLPEYAKCHKEPGHKNAFFSETLSYWLH